MRPAGAGTPGGRSWGGEGARGRGGYAGGASGGCGPQVLTRSPPRGCPPCVGFADAPRQAGSILFSPDPPSVGVGRAGATIGGGSSGSGSGREPTFRREALSGFVGHVRLRRGGPAGQARLGRTNKRGLFEHEDSAPFHGRRPGPLRGDRLRAAHVRDPKPRRDGPAKRVTVTYRASRRTCSQKPSGGRACRKADGRPLEGRQAVMGGEIDAQRSSTSSPLLAYVGREKQLLQHGGGRAQAFYDEMVHARGTSARWRRRKPGRGFNTGLHFAYGSIIRSNP